MKNKLTLHEEDLVLLDELHDILKGFEQDVYQPNMYSQERLAKALRNQLSRATAIVASYRQVTEALIYAPSETLDKQLTHNAQLKSAVEMEMTA